MSMKDLIAHLLCSGIAFAEKDELMAFLQSGTMHIVRAELVVSEVVWKPQ